MLHDPVRIFKFAVFILAGFIVPPLLRILYWSRTAFSANEREEREAGRELDQWVSEGVLNGALVARMRAGRRMTNVEMVDLYREGRKGEAYRRKHGLAVD